MITDDASDEPTMSSSTVVTSPRRSDPSNSALTTGLAVGIPVALITVLVIVLVVLFVKRSRKWYVATLEPISTIINRTAVNYVNQKVHLDYLLLKYLFCLTVCTLLNFISNLQILSNEGEV